MDKKIIAESILDWLKSTIMSQLNLEEHYLVSKGNDNGFENLVTEKIIPLFNDKKEELWPNVKVQMIPVLAKHFPDVELLITDVQEKSSIFGIELKSRNNGSWVTNGGSIFESTSNEDYEEIYLLFATRNKNETKYNVKWACYWSVASDIKVTHSPRYIIDMSSDNHIFSSSKEYQSFRKEDEQAKIKFVQKYFSNKLEKPTWYSNINNDTNLIRPTIWGEVEKKQKNRICAEMLVLFPMDLFPSSSTKYINCVEYLMSQYNIFIPNIRDQFSAGGSLKIDGKSFPHIFKEYKKHSKEIKSILNNPDEEFNKLAIEYWNLENASGSFAKKFKSIVFKTIDNTYPNDAEIYKNLFKAIIF